MKLYYIANAQMPHKKAYAIQITKMCEAFVETGVDLELIMPSQKRGSVDLQKYYKLRVPVHETRLPALNFYASGKWGFFLSSLSFMVSYFLYLAWKRILGKKGVVYIIDMDTFSFMPSLLLGMPCFFETHGGKAKTRINSIFFKYLNGVIVINHIIKNQISDTLGTPENKILVESNGIDLGLFYSTPKEKAREGLFLPSNRKIIMYCGRFYGWKGLEVLAEAVATLPKDIFVYIVGGTKEEFMNIIKRKDISTNLVFVGEQPYAKIPLWLSSADGLLVLGTKYDNQSYYYTSPMKVFEYMAIKRPIIASKTPAIQEILSSEEAIFYEPDNARDLADKICLVANFPESVHNKVVSVYARTKNLTWSARARRVAQFIQSKTEND